MEEKIKMLERERDLLKEILELRDKLNYYPQVYPYPSCPVYPYPFPYYITCDTTQGGKS